MNVYQLQHIGRNTFIENQYKGFFLNERNHLAVEFLHKRSENC